MIEIELLDIHIATGQKQSCRTDIELQDRERATGQTELHDRHRATGQM
jgi:hypothetical protein